MKRAEFRIIYEVERVEGYGWTVVQERGTSSRKHTMSEKKGRTKKVRTLSVTSWVDTNSTVNRMGGGAPVKDEWYPRVDDSCRPWTSGPPETPLDKGISLATTTVAIGLV